MLPTVQQLQTLAGPIALAIICLVVFLEEAGLPLPMFPGDGLLLTAGVMITAGQLSPWRTFPLVCGSALLGACLGYAWSRCLGRPGLERLADRLGLRAQLDRAASRLRRTGASGVVFGRLFPGTRVYTNLVAGAVGVPLPAFLPGLVLSATIWIFGFMGLGMALGVPAAHYVHQVQAGVLLLGAVSTLLVATMLSLRLVRPPRHAEVGVRRLALALAVDLALAGSIGVAGWVLTGFAVFAVTVSVGLALLVYAVATRLLFGATPGERLCRMSYVGSLTSL
ncbi:MAG TPA: DedA family protein [Candidatus Dormibacteraeota bacterium]|jgi:membrane-associated protein|nr:DedA family protein [Candidatus Dormibacteraeota bacterium]